MASGSNDGIFSYIYKNKWQALLLILIMTLAIAALYYLNPLFDGIIFGIFFAYVTRPIKEYFDRHTKFSPYVATFCILLPVVLILLYGVIVVRNELIWLSANYTDIISGIEAFKNSLGLPQEYIEAINDILENLSDYIIAFFRNLSIKDTAASILLTGMNALVSLFVCFYLLKDGDKFIMSLKEIMPATLRDSSEFFFNESNRIINGIYLGTFYTAIYITVVAFVIFLIFDVPYIILCTAFIFIAAMVPILSGMMVILPLTVYEYVVKGPLTAALFIGASIILVYIPPDYIIRPYLINKASKLHPLLIILSFIGGGLAGGLAGFFTAPLVIGLIVALYRTYRKFGEKTNENIH
jgi:predicted PurR-regulated permease PerM